MAASRHEFRGHAARLARTPAHRRFCATALTHRAHHHSRTGHHSASLSHLTGTIAAAMSMEESISLEETNKIRISLGLKPLSATKDDSADSQEKQAEDNFAKKKEQEAKDRESKSVQVVCSSLCVHHTEYLGYDDFVPIRNRLRWKHSRVTEY